jgi:hypothetical protein
LQINGPYEHPIILQALSRDEAQEWKKAIEEGIVLMVVILHVHVQCMTNVNNTPN